MGKTVSIKRNMVLNTLLSVSSILFSLVTFPYITRVLQPAMLGKVQFAIAVAGYFVVIANMGIPTYATRACARIREDREGLTRVVHELIAVSICTMAVAYIGLFLFVRFVPKVSGEGLLFFIVSFSIVAESMNIDWMYSAKEMYTYKSVRTLVLNLLALLITFIFVRKPEDYLIYAVISVIPAVGICLINLYNAPKHIYVRNVGDYHPLVHISGILVFFGLVATTKIYTNLDTVMLGLIRDNDQVGLYTVAVKVKTVLVAVVTSVSAVLLPRTASYVKTGDFTRIKYLINKTMHLAAILSFGGVPFFTIFTEETISIIAGSGYSDAVMPMRIIMSAVVFIAATDIMGIQLLVPMGEEKKVVESVAAGALINLILNAVLIPKFGASGAAAGTVAAEIVVFAVQYAMVRKMNIKAFDGTNLILIAVSSIIASAATLPVKNFVMNPVLGLMLGVVVFGTVYVAALAIVRDSLILELYTTVMARLKRYGK